MTVTVKYKGIELQLEGDFSQSYNGMYSEQSLPSYFETNEVYINDINIIDLMTEEDLLKCDSLALETLN
jgi:hypothetical protein